MDSLSQRDAPMGNCKSAVIFTRLIDSACITAKMQLFLEIYGK